MPKVANDDRSICEKLVAMNILRNKVKLALIGFSDPPNEKNKKAKTSPKNSLQKRLKSSLPLRQQPPRVAKPATTMLSSGECQKPNNLEQKVNFPCFPMCIVSRAATRRISIIFSYLSSSSNR